MKNLSDKERVAEYLRSMEMVERIAARELVGMTDEEAWRRMQLLRTSGPAWRERREWSGLVEQQAIFQRGMKR